MPTAAHSSLKNENKLEEDVDIIGQFGVGFYSAFMVPKEVTVRSKAYGSDQAYEWISEGADGYQIGPCAKDTVGTEIILTLKDNTEDEKNMMNFWNSTESRPSKKNIPTISASLLRWT